MNPKLVQRPAFKKKRRSVFLVFYFSKWPPYTFIKITDDFSHFIFSSEIVLLSPFCFIKLLFCFHKRGRGNSLQVGRREGRCTCFVYLALLLQLHVLQLLNCVNRGHPLVYHTCCFLVSEVTIDFVHEIDIIFFLIIESDSCFRFAFRKHVFKSLKRLLKAYTPWFSPCTKKISSISL